MPSEACAPVISIIAEEGQEGLHPAEKGTVGKALCSVVRIGWIKTNVRQIDGAERRALRLEEDRCVGRGFQKKREKEAGRIIAVIWKIY